MKSKRKFVLAGLFLLAITGLLALAGCKNDTVPETPKYTVKFGMGDNREYPDAPPTDITVDSGTKLTAEQLEPLAGTANYTFEGWYDGEIKAVGGEYTVTKDVTLVAKWSERGQVEIKLAVSGNTVELASVPPGATIHYTTDGTDPKTSESSQTGTSVSITKETTIKAYAEKVGELKESDVAEGTYYVVTFDKNADDATGNMDSKIFTEGVAQKLTVNGFSRSGYVFAGWAESAGGTVKYTDGQEITVAADTPLYAMWGVASVRTADGTITPYDTFDAALTSAMASQGSTLALLADISKSSSITISKGDFTLDLNGKAITSSATIIVETSDSANLTVTDTSQGKTGAIKPDSNTAKSVFQVGIAHYGTGKLTISGGSITAANSTANSSYGVWNNSGGTVEITGGTIASGEVGGAKPSAGVMNHAAGTVIISGTPTITGGASTADSSYGVWNYSGGTVEITGGAIASGEVGGAKPSAGVMNENAGTVIISGTPTITGGASTADSSFGVWNYDSGTVSISGSPTIASSAAGKVSASFRVQKADVGSITLESGFAPASSTSYSVSVGTNASPSAGIFAKPGTGATLDASWFTSYDASKFTVEKVGDNLELKAVTQ